jgi:hypothetical protein
VKHLWAWLLMASVTVLVGCGGSQPGGGPLAGNWQFTMAGPADNSFSSNSLKGGFLQQKQNAVTGSVVYTVVLPQANNPVVCNSGVAPVTGTNNGQTVTLTAVAGGQTFVLTGTLSADGSTMVGTYTSTAGQTADGTACGTAQSGLSWSASLVPTLTGSVQGSFHSAANNQDFPVSGFLTQGNNIGASSATVTGALTFQGYSCLGNSTYETIYLNGEISGNSLLLQIFGSNGLNIGQIGQSLGLNNQVVPVVFESIAPGGYVVHNTGAGIGYVVTTKACSLSDSGNICLAMGNGTGCTQPISLSPAVLTFPAQLVGSAATTQTISLTNTDPAGSTLTGLSLSMAPVLGDFNGLPHFLEQDTCASSPGAPFSLAPQQSCTITVSFSPQQSCTWVPSEWAPTSIAGNTQAAPAQCPPFVGATVQAPPALATSIQVVSPKSADSNNTFSVPIKGIGLSALVPSTPELDFGSIAANECSIPAPSFCASQTLSFTNQGMFPVTILGAGSGSCPTTKVTLTRPISGVDGLRVVQGNTITEESSGTPNSYITYNCELSNFTITQDPTHPCLNTTLSPGDTCAISISYSPPPGSNNANGVDDFVELNTQTCMGNSAQVGCEIDSGRFPVELKVNPASPLRMSPGAGLDFGTQTEGMSSAPMTITLTNDPADPNAGTVNFQGTVVSGDFVEADNCGASLASGSSCTMTVIFKPMSSGFQQSTIAINYTVTVPGSFVPSSPQIQTVYLRGAAQ